MNNNTIRTLSLSLSFCILLLSLRIIKSGQLFYLFLAWNLFLALLPYLITQILKKHPLLIKKTFLFWTAFSIWLILLPNAPYIITDLQHIRLSDKQDIWYDVILIGTFAINGLWLGLLSIDDMKYFLLQRFEKLTTQVCITIICFLVAFGIYLGRFLRWNSWDILTRPMLLVDDIIARIAHPIHYSQTWSFTLIFGCFILITYLLAFTSNNTTNTI